MGDKNLKESFIVCEKCGKKLIGRLPNGLWHFKFGRSAENEKADSPVEMYIYGSIKIKCLRRTCKHWNVLNYFPMKAEIKE